MSIRKLTALLVLVVGAVAAYFATGGQLSPRPADHPPPEPPGLYGWIDDPAAVRDCLAEMACGTFRHTAAFAARWDGPENVYLWESARTVTGDLLPARDQRSVGSCVGFATASAIEHLSCVQIEEGESAWRSANRKA